MKINQIPNPILHALALPFLPIVLVTLVILWIFRQAVRLWLHISLGVQFGGLLCSADKIYVPRGNASRKLILNVNYVRREQKIDISATLKRNIQEKIFRYPDLYPKLTGTCHSFLAQDYLLKNRVFLDDVVKTIPLPASESTRFDEEYLKRFMGGLANSPLPRNDTALWEVHVATEPLVNVQSNIEDYVYPVVIVIHHAVTDGIRCVHFLSAVFDAQLDHNYYDKLTKKACKNLKVPKNIPAHLIQVGQRIIYMLYLLITGIVTFLNFTFLKDTDRNAFKRPLKRENIIAWSLEPNGKRVTMVKDIKNRIPDTKFSDVLVACISASIFNFFKKKGWEVPENMSCLLPVLCNFPSHDESKSMDLRNDFIITSVEMPLVDPVKFSDGLERTKINMDRMRKSTVIDIVYWMTNYLVAAVPGPIIKLMANTKAYTCVISSLPGTSAVKLPSNCELISWGSAPHTNDTGVTFSIVTYDDKFHICLLVDKAIIPLQEEAQSIVDDVLRNVDVLYEETLKTYC